MVLSLLTCLVLAATPVELCEDTVDLIELAVTVKEGDRPKILFWTQNAFGEWVIRDWRYADTGAHPVWSEKDGQWLCEWPEEAYRWIDVQYTRIVLIRRVSAPEFVYVWRPEDLEDAEAKANGDRRRWRVGLKD